MKQKLCLLFVASFSSALAFGQSRMVTGRVVSDSSRTGLSGVTVTVRGSKVATATDRDGNFSISVPDKGSPVLVFSSVGFTPNEVTVGSRSQVSVTLTSGSSQVLSDVVVIGYQTVRRRDVTGSVSSISGRQIKDVPLANAAEAIQGRLAGVQVISSEGAPGAELLIRVRGGSSITQDNTPLYIVDGVQVANALSVIAPQDIASIDVLKDASTTAIYGAQGANGVVLITTKSGRNGKTQVAYSGAFGFRELAKKQQVLSPYEFVRWQWERSRGNTTDSASFAKNYGTTWDTLQNYKNIEGIDWQDRVFGNDAAFQNHNVSVNGGTENTSVNLSLTGNKEEGVQLQSGFDRKIANLKVDHKLGQRFRLGVNARYLDQTIRGAGTTTSGTRTTNRLRHAINYRPFELPVAGGGVDEFDEDYFLNSGNAINPVLLTEAEYRRQKTTATYLTGNLSVTLPYNLTFRSTVGFDQTNIRQQLFFSRITNTARQYGSLPVASIGDQLNRTIQNSNTLQYTLNNFRQKHDLTVMVGQETVQRDGNTDFVETRFFPADISPEKALSNMGLGSAPSGSAQPLPSSTVFAPYRLFSLFGRINYAFDDKYLLTFNMRMDQSSRFNPDNARAYFPSASIAWRLSQEKFLKDVSWLSDAKIRFGYGSVGNDRIGEFNYLQLYGVTGQYAFNHAIVPGFAPSLLANPELKWETNITRNLGFDLAFLKNRISLSVDLYKNSANDLLLAVAIPPTSGYTAQTRNIGATSNRGIEIQLNATPVQKKNFTWSSNFNISFNRNRIESLGGPSEYTVTSGWQGSDGLDDYLVKVGQPLGLMYGFQTDGYYKVEDFNYNATTGAYTLKPGVPRFETYGAPQPGMLKLKDLNGDSVITADKDRTVIGNANAKFIGGWNNQFSIGNFDASVFVNFVVGNDIYNANKLEWTDGSFANLNMLDAMQNRWTNIDANGAVVTDPTALAKLNENATIWSPVRVQRWWLHSWAVEDGSYLRINNVTVGYTLPKKITQRVKISSLRFYATVNNLATLTNYSGYDPDVSARRFNPLTPGVDFAAYPRSRTWVAGLNLTF
ncbi:TonB-dependent receptor [Flaviaesturariibacter amylovorans]|uniref:TonB-dependent receptor n=1 Tax=Flaviaesturariibacter amylovorans TaxID=1084520 RepID=A0ABP8GC32_9BACT